MRGHRKPFLCWHKYNFSFPYCLHGVTTFYCCLPFLLTGITCLVCFFLSLIFAQGGGNYVFTLFDNYSGNFPLLIVALFECIAISYVYGLKRYVLNLTKIWLSERENVKMKQCKDTTLFNYETKNRYKVLPVSLCTCKSLSITYCGKR